MSDEFVRDVVGVLVFLPAIAVWLIAMVDVLTRKDIGRRRRILTVALVALVFPLALLYLLGRPPSSVRRGPETADDPRLGLVVRLEDGASGGSDSGGRDAGFRDWVDAACAGTVPPTR